MSWLQDMAHFKFFENIKDTLTKIYLKHAMTKIESVVVDTLNFFVLQNFFDTTLSWLTTLRGVGGWPLRW